VTLVEYADLQCPYCAQWTRQALPSLVAEYVRTGHIRIVFRGLAFLGADSELALRMVVAAGAQDKQWDLLESLYRRQGHENSGWVNDELAGASAAAGVNTEGLEGIAWSAATTRAIARAARAAHDEGIRGTPSFEVGRTGGRMQPIHVGSLDAAGIRPALEALLAR